MLEEIIKIVENAGKIYKNAGEDLGISVKSSKFDLVTKYDKRVTETRNLQTVIAS